ncbi:MAG: archaellin/type IV pilin N-terminal domain-containing protein [Nitrososphaerota archaeon]
MRWEKPNFGKRGLTGLETAIILIAFVIVAAAFAFAVLNLGFASTQKSGEVLRAGMKEATSSIELSGSVIAGGIKDAEGKYRVKNVTIYVKTAVGKMPVDMSNDTLTISYLDPYKHVDRLLRSNDPQRTQVTVEEVRGDGDNLLEFGELWKIVIHIDNIYGGVDNIRLQPNDVFVVEIKPSVGSILKVERRIPPAIDPVMDLT